MSKRQRFFVELREGEVNVISWKSLVADAERAAAAAPPSNANVPENLKTAENSLKTRRKLKLEAPSSRAAERTRRGSSIGDRNMNSSRELQRWEDARNQKADVKMIKAVKGEFDEIAKPVGAKGVVHRSMPIPCASGGAKTSCRTQKKAKACSKKSNRT